MSPAIPQYKSMNRAHPARLKSVAIATAAVFLLLAPASMLMAVPPPAAAEFLIESKPRLRPEAREATHAYRYRNFIPPTMRIPDGYIDGGRGMKMHADGQVGSSRELMMVDRRNDARLRGMLAFARTPEIRSLDERERAVKLAAYLDEFSNASRSRRASARAADSLAADFRGRGVLIGDVVALCGGGSCRHRTLLYKLLADEAGLSVSMVRGRYRHSDGRLGSHAWNELYLEDGTVLLVDIMNPPRDWKFPAIREERPKKYLGPNAEALYDQPHVVWPPHVHALPKKGSGGRFTVEIFPPASGAGIFFTVDGSEPTEKSSAYQKPLTLPAGTIVKTVAVYPDGFTSRHGEVNVGESVGENP
jgi:hypothetical protein